MLERISSAKISQDEVILMLHLDFVQLVTFLNYEYIMEILWPERKLYSLVKDLFLRFYVTRRNFGQYYLFITENWSFWQTKSTQSRCWWEEHVSQNIEIWSIYIIIHESSSLRFLVLLKILFLLQWWQMTKKNKKTLVIPKISRYGQATRVHDIVRKISIKSSNFPNTLDIIIVENV